MKKIALSCLLLSLFCLVLIACNSDTLSDDSEELLAADYGVSINISVTNTQEDSQVSIFGNAVAVISDTEIETFGLGLHNLTSAVNAYFGKTPNDAYLRSPTPWGDLYTTNKWPQVQRKFTFQSADITSFSSSRVVIDSQSIVNNTNGLITTNIGMTKIVDFQCSATWSGESGISLAAHIPVQIQAEHDLETYSFTFSDAFYQNSQNSKAVPFNAQYLAYAAQVETSTEAYLVVDRYTMTVHCVFVSSLIGDVAVNYNPTYQSHHFWPLPIESVMHTAGMPTFFTTELTFLITYYFNPRIEFNE